MRSEFHRVAGLLLLSIIVTPLFAQESPKVTTPAIIANEDSATLRLLEKSSIFSIALSGNFSRPQPATLFAKIVDPLEKVLGEGSASVQLGPVARRSELPLNWLPLNGLQDVASVRLIYEVRLDGSAAATSGILSPYKLIPDLFELHFMALDAVGIGGVYVARVWATRPDSKLPVPGVVLDGMFGDENEADKSKGMRAHAQTDAHGEALMKFHLPRAEGDPDAGEVDFTINGSHGDFKNSVSATLPLRLRAAILLSTDKPIYQPEQTLHIRALLLDDQRRAWSKHPVRFAVHDPDNSVVFSSDTESSRFGIAAVDWPIPASQKLGNYSVSADISGDTDRELQNSQNIRISRYELPTLALNVQTNQPYYLPGQNAEVTVSAAYLFGALSRNS